MTNFEYIVCKKRLSDKEKYPLFFAVCTMSKRCSNCLIPEDMNCSNGLEKDVLEKIEKWLKEERKENE